MITRHKKKKYSLKKHITFLKRQICEVNATLSAEINALQAHLAALCQRSVSQSLKIQQLQLLIADRALPDFKQDASCILATDSCPEECGPSSVGLSTVASKTGTAALEAALAESHAGISQHQTDHFDYPNIESTHPSFVHKANSPRSPASHVWHTGFPDAVLVQEVDPVKVEISTADGCANGISLLSSPAQLSSSNCTLNVNMGEGNTTRMGIPSMLGNVEMDHSNAQTNFSEKAADENIKSEPVKVKVENLEDSAVCLTQSFEKAPVFKIDWELLGENYIDKLDNVSLQQRIKFLVSPGASALDCPSDLGHPAEAIPCHFNVKHERETSCRNPLETAQEIHSLEDHSADSRNSGAQGSTRRHKRRKTATNSVKTALEEDAPGLLQVLSNKGVNLNDVKLYELDENDEASGISHECNFVELEDVISKIFAHSSHLFKISCRQTKGARASYYVECLIALVEQARYLQQKNWPVEWGWCRDLQSFIFIFARHNRIVLERPEYGYATYFFELVGSISIRWQIMRLISAMKLSNCGRIALTENRPLVVGNDLSEGEARVMEEYGWRPNTGLGSMLNYCDRVVHDRKSDGENSDWNFKIGKLLMQGYDGGTIVLAELPKRLARCSVDPTLEE